MNEPIDDQVFFRDEKQAIYQVNTHDDRDKNAIDNQNADKRFIQSLIPKYYRADKVSDGQLSKSLN